MGQRAFEIPEIQRLIAQHLDGKDLVSLARVCKSSNDALTPCIWSSISSITSNDARKRDACLPGFHQGLQRNKSHVQAIAISNIFRDDFFFLRGCDLLKTLTVEASTEFYGGHAWSGQLTAEMNHSLLKVAGFIAAHSATLKEITITWFNAFLITPARELWSAIAQCSRLEKLILNTLAVDKDGLQDFLQACALPRTLELLRMAICDLSKWPCDDENENDLASKLDVVSIGNPTTTHISNASHNKRLTLEGPRHVTIWDLSDGPSFPGLSAFGQAMMLRRCINLEDFRWYPDICSREIFEDSSFSVTPESDKIRASKFFRGLAKAPWTLPHLKALVTHAGMVDEDLAAVLRQMNQLKIFTLNGTGFGPLSFQALIESGAGRLCNSVEELHFQLSVKVTSAMVTTILGSCPRLKRLLAAKVSMSDILKGPKWVCGDLHILDLFIEVDMDTEGYQGRAMERAVYEQLARLVKLEELSIGPKLPSYDVTGQNTVTLDLRLRAGMGALAGLKELRFLSFMRGQDQKMGMEEAHWIAKNWPKLEDIYGPIDQDPLIVKEMAQILSQVGTKYFCSTHRP